jgi:phage/plasmid-like protein (TIGR03299 family)
MAHELLIEGVRAAMFYVNERPWHGLGTRLTSPPTSAEAIRAARLDWRVVKAPLYVANQAGIYRLPKRFALLREDQIGQPDCHVFGIVGRQYEPLQNAEAFEFFDPLVRSGDVSYETAGALRHGERVWIQARLGEDVEIVSGDAIQRYLLLSTSHDGSSSVQVKLTPVRVVCNNTLTLALSRGRTFRVAHDRDVRAQLEAARAFLGFVRAEYDQTQALFRRLASTKLSHQLAQKYFAEVFPDRRDAESTRRAEDRRRWATHFYLHGRGHDLPAVKETMWAAYNGVTEFVDHCKARESGSDTNDGRLASVWFGQGATIKERALRTAADWTATNFQLADKRQ